MPEDGSVARCGAQQVQHDSNGSRLGGAVQPEESKDFTTRDLQVKMIYSDESSVVFSQSTD
jgi:hypothetical protein